MKAILGSAIGALAMALIGCGEVSIPDVAIETPSEQPAAEATVPRTPAIPINIRKIAAINDSGDTTIGALVGFNMGNAVVYLSADDRYVTVNLTTGQYESYPYNSSVNIYFSGTSCTGTGIIVGGNLIGELGKTVFKGSNSVFYQVDSVTNESGFAYQSYLSNSGCNANVSTLAPGLVLNVSIVADLDSMTADAPYTLDYTE